MKIKRQPLKQKALVVGLTGGIATGKSEVLKVFREMGFTTVSSDELAHQCIKRGQPAYRDILRHFGPAVLGLRREIDRKALGKIVFASASARRRLETIIHPCVVKTLQRYVSRNKGLLALDIPLLFEARLSDLVDRVIVVYSNRKRQIDRLIRYRRLSREEALQRVEAQWPVAKKSLWADYILDNTGDLRSLHAHTRQLLKGWTRKRIIKTRV